MAVHARDIQKIRNELLLDGSSLNPEDHRKKIEYCFRSEWMPEYMAGALAAGEYAAKPGYGKLKIFLKNCLGNVSEKKNGAGNIHLYRHALIAAPLFLKYLPEDETVIIRAGHETVEYTAGEWREHIRLHMVDTIWQAVEPELLADFPESEQDEWVEFFKNLCDGGMFENHRERICRKLEAALAKKLCIQKEQMTPGKDFDRIGMAIESCECQILEFSENNAGLLEPSMS